MVQAAVIEVDINLVHPNPSNPRTIKDANFKKLVKSLKDFPEMLWKRPPVVVTDGDGYMALGGNKRTEAAKAAGYKTIPIMIADDWDYEQRKKFIVLDNDQAGDWDFDMLKGSYTMEFLLDMTSIQLPASLFRNNDGQEDVLPEEPAEPVTRSGDVWLLGDHRIMCGDSTVPSDVATLMNSRTGMTLHADPPYGMGKQADGVENDNLYRAKLDEFQMKWWRAYRQHVLNNASVFIWGNAPDLWRLWYVGGLSESEYLEMRNEIVWDKKNIAGMASPDLTQFPVASERCLFFQIGKQFLGNVNADDFPEEWEPLRAYFEGEAKEARITAADIKRVCGCQMYGHWFSRSQFTLMPRNHYETMGKAYPGSFTRPWQELKDEWDRVKGAGRTVINGKLDGRRSYFDNAHDVMRDTWEFPRVVGDERFGHATPKPVAMVERAIRSTTLPGAIVVEPFLGSGSTLIAAEKTGTQCYGMELTPSYVDVCITRWQQFTGRDAFHQDGRSFAEVKAELSAEVSG